ncbi:MAG: deoxyribodipyrimidine photo-lyase [Gammaproteobacteria bacterium]|nr:deoxyribodipyrimidine photo-lyase [Gammaproteobacteria bacterium]
MSTQPAIIWFRSDLRLADNPALTAAAASGRPLVALYILDESSPGRWAPGGASRWWLHHSLARLADDIAGYGGQLILRRGSSVDQLAAQIGQVDAGAIYWNKVHEPWALELDEAVRAELRGRVELHRSLSNLLVQPGHVLNGSGEPFKVFTPFYKKLLQLETLREPLPVPPRLTVTVPANHAGETLDDWQLLPRQPDWARGFTDCWEPGEAGAERSLMAFADNAMRDYMDTRNSPDVRGTSRLSPHLRFGEISPAQVWRTVRELSAARSNATRGADGFLRELVWREFSYHLLHFWPQLPEEPFREQFAAFPWRHDAASLAAWQQGLTGYPLVDAGMRELWQTGWMHNRVRMVVASFLVKHLLVPWQDGAQWFWDTLVDADLANNSASWQWVAGCGADAAPYFRIFNPILQGTKFDPAGDYVRRWVPELAAVPERYIHEPWRMSAAEAADCGVQLERDYPLPMVDHASARKRALDAFAALQETSPR